MWFQIPNALKAAIAAGQYEAPRPNTFDADYLLLIG